MLRLLANREQNKDNFVKIAESQTGCCPEKDYTECLYTYSDASLKEVTSITIDGETFNLADGTTEGEAINTAYTGMSDGADKVRYTRQVVLPYLFKSAGVLVDGRSVTITNSGADFEVESEVAIKFNAKEADTTKCVRVAYCDFCLNWAGDKDNFTVTIDGSDNVIAVDTTGDFDYPGNEANIKAKLVDALTGAEEIVVMDDTVNTTYKVVLTYPEGTSVIFDGVKAPCCNVEQGWTA